MKDLTLPTIEAIEDERNKYAQHLSQGGEPIQIIVRALPWEQGMDWRIITEFPKELSHLKWTLEFTQHIKEQIIKAVQPPKT